jgi:hypothetical protein
MKALGVTLALGCAMVLPATARAESIGVHEGKPACEINSYNSGDQGVHVGTSRRVVSVSDDNDGTFNRRSGLEQSVHFANLGSLQAFADDRISFGDQISSVGFGEDLRRAITMALRGHHRGPGGGDGRHGDGDGDHGGRHEGGGHEGGRGILVPRADAEASPNPEPASMLLIGTGLAGLFRYRRQLFV